MPETAPSTGDPTRTAESQTLREVVEALAPLERLAGSPGEEQAARSIAARLSQAGWVAAVEEERFLDGYAALIGGLAGAGAVAGVAGLV